MLKTPQNQELQRQNVLLALELGLIRSDVATIMLSTLDEHMSEEVLDYTIDDCDWSWPERQSA